MGEIIVSFKAQNVNGEIYVWIPSTQYRVIAEDGVHIVLKDITREINGACGIPSVIKQ